METPSKNLEILSIRIKNNTRPFNIIAVYRKPYGQEKNNTWNDIFKFKEDRLDTIIMADFNAHHTLWNCQNIDKWGKII